MKRPGVACDAQNILGLSVPPRVPPAKDSFLANPKEVKTWLSRLPMTNLGAISCQVYQKLIQFNQEEIPLLKRVKVTKLFRSTVYEIDECLRKHYINTTLPLSEKSHKIALFSRELQGEMAVSYQILIEQALANPGKPDKKQLTNAIHRAINHLSDDLCQATLVYDPTPKCLWKEFHCLYALAAKFQIEHIQVRDKIHKLTDNKTISDLYKRILLFSLAAPSHLRQRDIQRLYRVLLKWAPYTEISSPGTHEETENRFIIHLKSDNPPTHIVLEKHQIDSSCCTLCTHELLQHLKQLVQESLPQQRNPTYFQRDDDPFSPFLLHGLIRSWSVLTKREFVRSHLDIKLDICVGLTGIYTLLNPALEDETSSLDDKLHTLEADAPAYWTSQARPSAPKTFSCTTLNQSAGGYCITWPGPDAPKIRVGELLGIRPSTDTNIVNLAVIRWLKNAQEEGLEAGIQMLSPSCIAVKAHLVEDHHNSNCLLLPAVEPAHQQSSLITPTPPFKLDSILSITDGDAEQQIKLSSLVEATGAFVQYHYEEIKIEQPTTDKETADKMVEFEVIWDIL